MFEARDIRHAVCECCAPARLFCSAANITRDAAPRRACYSITALQCRASAIILRGDHADAITALRAAPEDDPRKIRASYAR